MNFKSDLTLNILLNVNTFCCKGRFKIRGNSCYLSSTRLWTKILAEPLSHAKPPDLHLPEIGTAHSCSSFSPSIPGRTPAASSRSSFGAVWRRCPRNHQSLH